MQDRFYTAQFAIDIGVVGMCSDIVALLEGIVKHGTVLGQDETVAIRREYGNVIVIEAG